MQWYYNLKNMAKNIGVSALTAVKVAARNTNLEMRINSDKYILGKNLGAMVKTRCEGCRKL